LPGLFFFVFKDIWVVDALSRGSEVPFFALAQASSAAVLYSELFTINSQKKI
jgi:hypothetical protein